MHYHILLTENCNSECKYCYEKSMKEFDNGLDKRFKFDFSGPENSEVDVEKLKEFLEKDKEAVLVFYGGEPLLQIEKIKEIIDKINVPFRMQTNGKLLDQLPIEYVKKIDKILVSLDGDKERTDENRGAGTYDKVMGNVRKIREEGYSGEIIARMTICFTDVCEQVLHLVESGYSVHWQLDAGFYKNDYSKEFGKFIKMYDNSIERLIDYWIGYMEGGKVIRLYPFLAIVESLLKGEKTKLRCGAGHSGYAITTDGKIVACPIMNCVKDFEAGSLDSKPEELKKFEIGGECLNCSYLDLCGGRCLYSNKAELWPEEGRKAICKSIQFYIDKLKERMPEINELINSGTIKKQDFDYEKYFGPEIIP